MLKNKLSKEWGSCTPQELESFERNIGFRFPDDYRAFILESNGGTLDSAMVFKCDNKGRMIEEGIETFYGLGAPNWADIQRAYQTYHINQRRMPDYLIAIGSDAGGNQIAMLLNNLAFGYVVYWDHENEVDFDDPEDAKNPLRNCSLIAKSFTDFVAMLQPQVFD
ncbi:SMI1/KNR4 family protein [Oligoflexus tunisiensis]|uniref:SMI1/KNR4 family protein n=1 Tax=Oligoflexus tunisiensis TaxID=708132 RepID=UPI00114C8B16|nr:SMI1/KNR4 family protein [Oligoflexus tunisiensis]